MDYFSAQLLATTTSTSAKDNPRRFNRSFQQNFIIIGA
jgi:hypothetical protein